MYGQQLSEEAQHTQDRTSDRKQKYALGLNVVEFEIKHPIKAGPAPAGSQMDFVSLCSSVANLLLHCNHCQRGN